MQKNTEKFVCIILGTFCSDPSNVTIPHADLRVSMLKADGVYRFLDQVILQAIEMLPIYFTYSQSRILFRIGCFSLFVFRYLSELNNGLCVNEVPVLNKFKAH